MIGERIKQLRKALKLSQTAFGEPIGANRNVINNAENGRAAVSDMLAAAIIKEYKVSPEWLKLGVGEMFAPRSREEDIAAFFGELSRDPDGSVRKRFIACLAQLPLESWDAIDAFCRKVYGLAPPEGQPKEDEGSEGRPAEAPPDIDHA